jgi:hypothetical protein
MGRIPLKGKPDFSTWTDEEVRQNVDLIQKLLFSYAQFGDVHSALQRAWKDLSNESTDRLCSSAEKSLDSQEKAPVRPTMNKPLLKKVGLLRREKNNS